MLYRSKQVASLNSTRAAKDSYRRNSIQGRLCATCGYTQIVMRNIGCNGFMKLLLLLLTFLSLSCFPSHSEKPDDMRALVNGYIWASQTVWVTTVYHSDTPDSITVKGFFPAFSDNYIKLTFPAFPDSVPYSYVFNTDDARVKYEGDEATALFKSFPGSGVVNIESLTMGFPFDGTSITGSYIFRCNCAGDTIYVGSGRFTHNRKVE